MAQPTTLVDSTNTPYGTDANPFVVTVDDPAHAEHEEVAASQSDQVMGATGALGDFLGRVLIVPATTSPGVVQIKDGGGSAITIFTGGASSVTSLVPFSVPLNLYSTAGAWKITTGANVSCVVSGNFT